MNRVWMLVVLLLPAPIYAQLYKWVDADGVTQYSQTPPAHVQASDTLSDRYILNGGESQANGHRLRQSQSNSNKPSKASRSISSGRKKSVVVGEKVNCHKAIARIQGVVQRYEASLQDLQDSSKKQKIQRQLQRVKRKNSITACKGARGQDLAVYRCLGEGKSLAQCRP